jgi:hypothetical protein
MHFTNLPPFLPWETGLMVIIAGILSSRVKSRWRTVMPKYLFAYHGGGAPTNPEDQKKVMDAWGAWFGTLGRAVVDGGNPVGPSSTVKADGSLVAGGGANPVSGYSLIEAADLNDAHQKAKGCPLLKAGGTIEIAQAFDM